MDRPQAKRDMAEPVRSWRRRWLAILAASVVFAGIFFLRRSGILDGVAALVFAVLLASLAPWSASLSRRILLAGALFFGWIPLLWWVRLPVPQVDRMGLVLAVGSAGLVAWVLWAPDVGARLKRTLPKLAGVDVIMLATLAVAAWTVWPLLGSTGAEGTLNVLSGNLGLGADHVSHGAMVLQIRDQGAIVPMLGPAVNGSTWTWNKYPQNFHASVVALTELYSGSSAGGAAAEILRYGRSLALMQVMSAVLLAAGVAQLSNVRRRPAIAWPLAAIVVAAFLFGTGSWALRMGYENFVWACVAASLAALAATPTSWESPMLRMIAVGGLVVAAVHSWSLLAPLAAVGACLVFLPWRQSPLFASRRDRIMAICVLAVTVAASAVVLPILMREGIGQILTIQAEWVPQGRQAHSPLILASGAAIAASLAAFVRVRDHASRAKAIGILAIPVIGLLQLAALALYQYVRIGEVSYYFDKTLWGLGLVSIAALAAALTLHVDPTPPDRGPRLRVGIMVASVAATAAASQLFGVAGIDYRAWAERRIAESPPVGHRILAATAIAESRPFASTVYIAAMSGDPPPILSDRYQRALSLTWTEDTMPRELILKTIKHRDGIDVEEVATAARELLEAESDLAVVVAPEIFSDVRALLPADLADRVVTWESE